MATLEDSILKKNIPGRYSSWTNENDDRRRDDDDDANGRGNDDDGSDSEDDEYYFEGLPPASSSAAPQPPPSSAAGKNTGVKGVLADYCEHQRQEQLRKEEERLEDLRILQRATRLAVRTERATESNNDKGNKNKNDEGDSDLDDSDDEFFKQFRNQRLAQLQQGGAASAVLPTFGSLESVSPEEYVRLVDETDPRVFLVVHLYESTMRQCQMLHSALERVAQCMDRGARFVEVGALEANPNLDTICLPAVLIYRGGELVHNVVRLRTSCRGVLTWRR